MADRRATHLHYRQHAHNQLSQCRSCGPCYSGHGTWPAALVALVAGGWAVSPGFCNLWCFRGSGRSLALRAGQCRRRRRRSVLLLLSSGWPFAGRTASANAADHRTSDFRSDRQYNALAQT